MERAKDEVTPQQVDMLAAVLGVRFVIETGTPVKPDCSNRHRGHYCKNEVTQYAVCGHVSIRTCSDSFCRLYAMIAAHYGNLPANAAPRVFKALAELNVSEARRA